MVLVMLPLNWPDPARDLVPLVKIFRNGIAKYCLREFSLNIIRCQEGSHNLNVQIDGFEGEITDDEAESPGYETKIQE